MDSSYCTASQVDTSNQNILKGHHWYYARWECNELQRRCPICRWSLASRPPLLLRRDFLTWHFGRRGEKAIASAIRKGDPEEYVRQKADRKLHLVRMRVEKLNYYFEREVCPTHMAHRLPAHHLLHHLLHPRAHHHHLLCLCPRE